MATSHKTTFGYKHTSTPCAAKAPTLRPTSMQAKIMADQRAEEAATVLLTVANQMRHPKAHGMVEHSMTDHTITDHTITDHTITDHATTGHTMMAHTMMAHAMIAYTTMHQAAMVRITTAITMPTPNGTRCTMHHMAQLDATVGAGRMHGGMVPCPIAKAKGPGVMSTTHITSAMAATSIMLAMDTGRGVVRGMGRRVGSMAIAHTMALPVRRRDLAGRVGSPPQPRGAYAVPA